MYFRLVLISVSLWFCVLFLRISFAQFLDLSGVYVIADANGIPLSWQCHGHYLVVGRLPYLLFISTNHSDYTYFVV